MSQRIASDLSHDSRMGVGAFCYRISCKASEIVLRARVAACARRAPCDVNRTPRPSGSKRPSFSAAAKLAARQ